jgi:sugar phosphate isomerase/epimerase
VAEKSLDYVSAEFAAMTEMARHFGGEPITVETLYAAFRRGWEAGCDKGPDEVVAMKAWADFAEKSLERARQLYDRGSMPLNALLDREAQLRIARSNAQNRAARLDLCRTALFPSLEEIMAIGKL